MSDAAPTERDGPLRSVWDTVDGLRVHGRVATARAGVPIVFVHGLGVSTRYLEPTMTRVAADFPVAGIDLPGFGRSDSPGHAYDITELARALATWLDARRIGPAILVGNSYGCQVIVECVSRAPSRALGLVLNAPTMDPGHRTVAGVLVRFAADAPRERPRLTGIVARDYLRAGPLRLLTTLRHALRHRIEELLPELEIPVLVVAGARDPLVTVEWAGEVARLAGSARAGAAGGELQVVPTAAHALPYDEPEAFAALIRAFAERVAARGPAAARA